MLGVAHEWGDGLGAPGSSPESYLEDDHYHPRLKKRGYESMTDYYLKVKV